MFPGSFDPFTVGHYDIVKQALKIFDKVIIAIGINSAKKGMYSTDDRIDIIKKSVEEFGDAVEIDSYSGLTVEYAKKLKVDAIIRGVRTTTDFEFEMAIAQTNTLISADDVSTVFIPATSKYASVSSTVVRDLLMHKYDPTQFMCPNVDLTIYNS